MPKQKYTPTKFALPTSHYDKKKADRAVTFIENLCHTKGEWAGKPFSLIDWQEAIVRDLFGVVKSDGARQFNTAYIEVAKKQGKSELAAAVALYLLCADGEQRAEIYGAAADRQQAGIVFSVAADMVRFSPALSKRVKILESQKRLIYRPTNSVYQVLSAEAYSKHGFSVSGLIFDECYSELLELPKFAALKERFGTLTSGVHDGYFSQDKKGNLKNTRGDTADDYDTYSLIMKDKEQLHSFSSPLRFIWSHSALKEVWVKSPFS